MERLTKKSIALKIAIVVVFVLLFNFSAPTISQAGVADVIGGTLLSPIIDLLLAIGDGAVNLIQSILFGIENSLLKVAVHNADLWETIGMIVGAVAGIAAVIAITIVTGGAALSAIIPALVAAGIGAYAGYKITTAILPDTFYLPVYAISPEEIFSNKIGLLDVNFFNPNPDKYADQTTETGETVEQQLTSVTLQPTISSWYLTLRNLALVVLLSVLLYIGIRIVTSTAAQDKAKYKEKLSSWIIAMCILFFMHYIMSFATTVVEAISEGINTINKPVLVIMPDLEKEDYEVEVVQTNDEGKAETKGVKAKEWFETAGLIVNGEYYWPTNLMGRLRISMQMDANLTEDNRTLRQLGYVVLFLVLVFYTIAFLVVYIKRLIMLAFLTMIAPLVAMTYPLDKMNDGNAQAFNMWLKEYVFNLLIQPLHLILYTMLVGSAIEFATENMIYAIVAIGFIFEAEKILRRFFGFDKASTVDANGSAVGGALAMAGVNQLRRLAGAGNKKKSGNGSGNGGSGSGGGAAAASARKIKTRDLLNQISGRNRQAGNGAGGAQLSDDSTGGTQPQLSSQPEIYDPNKSDEWNRMEGDRRALNDLRLEAGDSPTQDQLDAFNEWDNEINESDTRGIRTWASDLYQGSRLQSRVNGVTGAIGSGLQNASDYISRSAPARMARQLGANARSVRDMAADRALSVANKANELRTKIPKPIRNSARTLGGHIADGARAAGDVARGVGAVGMEGLKYAAPRAAKGLGKAAVKGGLAVTAGAIGVAGGLASGDDKNVLRYGAAGAAAGWAAGSGTTGVVKDASETLRDVGATAASTYTIAAHGTEAEKERQLAIEDREAMKDKDRQKLYADELNLSKGEVKQVMEEAQQYREQGITDDGVIIKAMKTDGFGNGRASQEKILLAALASETGKDNKKIKDLEERLKDKIPDENEVKKYIDGVREITGAI